MDCYCKTCRKTMNEKQFYHSHNLEKYPSGLIDQCKNCLTMFVDNLNPETYVWILEELDVPYVPKEWDTLVMRYCVPDKKITGTTILGRYLSKMKLNQYKEFRWKDTQYIQEVLEAKAKAAMKTQGYEAAEIAQALDESRARLDPTIQTTRPDPTIMAMAAAQGTQGASASYASFMNQQPEEDDLDLTEEDKLALRIKWGKTYRPDEWVALEKLYEEMMASYDIQTAGHIDTLKLICKTSLKANQLIDIGDVDGFQKMSKTYNDLMKSGKFTAAQNKEEQGEAIDSLGELFAICETKGFIPRYYVEQPNDKVDETLMDMKRYTKTLVTEELNLGNLIEQAVKEATKEDKANEDDSEAELDFEEDNNVRDIEQVLANEEDEEDYVTDQDYIDFKEEIENWGAEDGT